MLIVYRLGPTDGWASPVTLCLMIIGFLLVAIFIWWETKYSFPLMPPFIWRDRNFNLVSAFTTPGPPPSLSGPTFLPSFTSTTN